MVARCHALRKVPLDKLAAGDCRVLIGQGIGTHYLVPIALTFVEADPLLEGDYYPGDLLLALCSVEAEYWTKHPELQTRLVRVAKQASAAVNNLQNPLGAEKALLKDIDAYLSQAGA
jgi:hypothetical protein